LRAHLVGLRRVAPCVRSGIDGRHTGELWPYKIRRRVAPCVRTGIDGRRRGFEWPYENLGRHAGELRPYGGIRVGAQASCGPTFCEPTPQGEACEDYVDRVERPINVQQAGKKRSVGKGKSVRWGDGGVCYADPYPHRVHRPLRHVVQQVCEEVGNEECPAAVEITAKVVLIGWLGLAHAMSR